MSIIDLLPLSRMHAQIMCETRKLPESCESCGKAKQSRAGDYSPITDLTMTRNAAENGMRD